MKLFVYSLLFSLLFIHAALLYCGLAGISTTLILYFLISVILIRFTAYFFRENDKLRTNLKLIILSSICSLFALELVIKYVLKYNLSYSESNGGYFYSSPYRSIIYQNAVKKYFFNQNNLWLYVNKPNLTKTKVKTEFTYTRHYNSIGLRGPEPDTSTVRYNIIALGDSFTEGVGVVEDSTWFRLFIKMLNENNSTCNYQGINSAISGSDLFYEYIKLRELFLPYKPKSVILSINSSDIFDVYIRGGFNRFKENGIVKYNAAPWWEPFYASSFIFRYFVNNIIGNKHNKLSGIINEHEEDEIITTICRCISDYYIPLSKKYKFSLFVVFHPLSYEIGQESKILKKCEANLENVEGIYNIDMFKEWNTLIKDNAINIKDVYWQYDLHHKPYGNLLWAKIMYNKTEERLMCKNP